MAQQYRAIVIGCGAVGAATAYWLSRRLGGGVLAVEQYQLGHDRGASEDHSRVIRHAYSRPEYTALTPAAYQSWNVAERGTGLQLVRVLVCAGAGHAGKFAALLGRIIAELALDGSTRFPVSAFSATRSSLASAAPAPTRVNSM